MLLIYHYPICISIIICKYIGKLYGFKCIETRALKDIKLNRKKQNKDTFVGHATSSKYVQLNILDCKLFSIEIEEGEDLTADHFFLQRPLFDAIYWYSKCKDFIQLDSNSIIFDPGCGTGKHLFYLVDELNCTGIGIDIYKPAISVANKLNIGNKVAFHKGSSLDIDYLSSKLPQVCDLVFINSWIGHVSTKNGFNKFIQKLNSISLFIMIIASPNDNIHEIFNDFDLILFKDKGETHYYLFRGKA